MVGMVQRLPRYGIKPTPLPSTKKLHKGVKGVPVDFRPDFENPLLLNR